MNTSYKPNKLQLLGVLAHLNLTGAKRRNPSSESKSGEQTDQRSLQSSSKQRFIAAGSNKSRSKLMSRNSGEKTVLACHSSLILTMQDRSAA